MYMINNNDIFMQVRKGETLARLVSLEIRGGSEAEARRRTGQNGQESRKCNTSSDVPWSGGSDGGTLKG